MTIVVSVKNFIRVHGLNIASFQYSVSEIDAENGDVLTKLQSLGDETGYVFFNLRFYVEILINWNGNVVIIFNHETWLSNLSLQCGVNQHLI
jgi:hypothetical protein